MPLYEHMVPWSPASFSAVLWNRIQNTMANWKRSRCLHSTSHDIDWSPIESLANINKEKISLADQLLPDAKCLLFGEDFSSVASKQVELCHGLAKNLSNAQKSKQTTGNFSK